MNKLTPEQSAVCEQSHVQLRVPAVMPEYSVPPIAM
jgi:hypothetical protein